MLAALHVHCDDVEAGAGKRRLEGLPERRRDTTNLSEPRRVEPAAVPEDPPDRLVFPRRHLLEHVQLAGDELQAKRRTSQQAQCGPDLAGADVRGRPCDFRCAEFEPQLRRLVHGLEEQLVGM